MVEIKCRDRVQALMRLFYQAQLLLVQEVLLKLVYFMLAAEKRNLTKHCYGYLLFNKRKRCDTFNN